MKEKRKLSPLVVISFPSHHSGRHFSIGLCSARKGGKGRVGGRLSSVGMVETEPFHRNEVGKAITKRAHR